MTAFEIFALVWPAVVGLLVIAVGFFTMWLNERVEGRKAR